MSHEEHHQHLYIHFDDEALRLFRGHRLIEEKLDIILLQLIHQEKRIMATVQEVKDAVAAEAAQVKDRIDGLVQQVTDLQAQVANGGVATAADLDEILASIQNIFVPTPPPAAA